MLGEIQMEHEEFSASIWESFSSDECGSGTSSLLPELCSPDNCSWQVPQSTSKLALQEDNFIADHQELLLDKSMLFSRKSDHLTNPDSPCSPLFFNLPVQDHYGALHLQIQQLPVFNSSKSCTPGLSPGYKRARIKHEVNQVEQDEEHCPAAAKRRLLETKSSADSESKSQCENSITSTVALGPALNTDGKPRAKRGSATDPQSVYARQRRERINERLRALQGLVPNGAKVDIVTMLEEAINYVKFLQLQVKLLSSDEYWMYAPTTYNGMNISLGMHLGMQSYLKAKD